MAQSFQISLLKKGDRDTQFFIYKQYAEAMFHLAARLLNNKEDAEEVVQNAFIKAFSDIAKLKKHEAFGAWLKQIVIRLCLNHLRKQKIDFINIDEIHLSESTPDTDALIAPECLWKMINELPNGSRTILQLYLVEAYKHHEIASMLGISVSTSKSQYQRALSLLRQKYKEVNYE